MNIGIRYSCFDDVILILFLLKNGDIKADFSGEGLFNGINNPNKIFEIRYKDDTYIFSTNNESINNCDLKVWAKGNSDNLSTNSFYDLCVFTPGDTIRNEITDFSIQNFVNNGNIILSMCTLPYKHKNIIFDPLLGLIFHYYKLGFRFLNYYKNSSEKLNLIGTYHRTTHISGNVQVRRNELYEDVKRIVYSDITIFYNNDSKFDLLLDSNRYFGQWIYNHISGYSDYSTSVCNLIYETCDSLGSYNNGHRMIINEKTLKGLLFSKQNLFFMWYGNECFLPYLKEYGFWFLNFEFYDENDVQLVPDKRTAIYNSILKTSSYLVELKKELGTNQLVYEFLLSKYSDKLQYNTYLIDKLMSEYSNTDQFISKLKSSSKS